MLSSYTPHSRRGDASQDPGGHYRGLVIHRIPGMLGPGLLRGSFFLRKHGSRGPWNAMDTSNSLRAMCAPHFDCSKEGPARRGRPGRAKLATGSAPAHPSPSTHSPPSPLPHRVACVAFALFVGVCASCLFVVNVMATQIVKRVLKYPKHLTVLSKPSRGRGCNQGVV